MDTTQLLPFERYQTILKSNYSPHYVRDAFYKVQRILGPQDPTVDLLFITVRLKGKVDGIKTDWRIANSVANTLDLKISNHFWGRKSRYCRMKFIAAIESSANWDKEHIHAIVKMENLKRDYGTDEMIDAVKSIANSLFEVNEKDPTSVIVRNFPYSETPFNTVGNAIAYICKSASSNYDPFIRNLKSGKQVTLDSLINYHA
jgi:hypothetical protein